MTVQSTFSPQTLSDGTTIPGIAFGVGTAWYGKAEETTAAVKLALDAGYRSIDCAEIYGNEAAVGKALKESNVAREELFITTKCGPGLKDLRKSVQTSLKDLGVSQIDLYLIHFPKDLGTDGFPSLEEAWRTMEELKDEGIVKSIGVSNYTTSDLERTLAVAKHKPQVNQIEFHPFVYSRALHLQEFMAQHGIKTQAYGPCVPITKFAGTSYDKVLERITAQVSERTGQKVSSHQILLKLAATLGAIVVTTSSKEERLKEQLLAGEITLEDEEVAELKTAAPEHKRFFKNVFLEE